MIEVDAREANPSDRDLQRASGSGRIVLSGSENGTRIDDMCERSPIRILFPKTRVALEEAVLVNTAGGIAGGDRLEYVVTAQNGASIAVTTQAAERVYRALSDPARIETKLHVSDGARLAWLPQETIVFNSARLRRETEVDVSDGAELLALEWLVLGRAAHGEQMTRGFISDSWRVKKSGRLIWADTLRITDDLFSQLHRNALLSTCSCVGTLIYFGRDLEARLELLREIVAGLACRSGVTLVGGVAVVRFAAEASLDLRNALRAFLRQFGRDFGPHPFRVPKMWETP